MNQAHQSYLHGRVSDMALTPAERIKAVLNDDAAEADEADAAEARTPEARVANIGAPPQRRAPSEPAAVPVQRDPVPDDDGGGEHAEVAKPAAAVTTPLTPAAAEPAAETAKPKTPKKAPVVETSGSYQTLYVRLSVPAAEAVRAEREALKCTQTEVVLSVLRACEEQLLRPEPVPANSGSAFLPAARPPKRAPIDGPTSALSLRLTHEEHDAVNALAKATGRTQVRLVEDACTQYFKLADS